jgi:lycopene beta-cyclase
MLAAMLLGAASPGERWRVMQRFYRLPEGLVERFYAGGSNMMDKARILAGKPPVPLGAALTAILGRAPLADLGGGL